MKGNLKRYDTADQYTYNITELGKMFDISRDTVRRRLHQFSVKPHGNKAGNPVYVLRDAAMAIIMIEMVR